MDWQKIFIDLTYRNKKNSNCIEYGQTGPEITEFSLSFPAYLGLNAGLVFAQWFVFMVNNRVFTRLTCRLSELARQLRFFSHRIRLKLFTSWSAV